MDRAKLEKVIKLRLDALIKQGLIERVPGTTDRYRKV